MGSNFSEGVAFLKKSVILDMVYEDYSMESGLASPLFSCVEPGETDVRAADANRLAVTDAGETAAEPE